MIGEATLPVAVDSSIELAGCVNIRRRGGILVTQPAPSDPTHKGTGACVCAGHRSPFATPGCATDDRLRRRHLGPSQFLSESTEPDTRFEPVAETAGSPAPCMPRRRQRSTWGKYGRAGRLRFDHDPQRFEEPLPPSPSHRPRSERGDRRRRRRGRHPFCRARAELTEC